MSEEKPVSTFSLSPILMIFRSFVPLAILEKTNVKLRPNDYFFIRHLMDKNLIQYLVVWSPFRDVHGPRDVERCLVASEGLNIVLLDLLLLCCA